MAYSPQTWQNGASATPINAVRLSHIESGVQGVDQRLAVIEAAVSAGLGGNELAWNGSDYTPSAFKANTSLPRTFKGPIDPATVTGVVLNGRPWYDSWLQVGVSGYGPTGAATPPQTPAYNTPATTVAGTLSAVQTALNAASGGEVIEYTGPAITGISAELTYVSGSENWATNVLVRPPLGARGVLGGSTSDNFSIRCAHVTVAGFNVNGGTRVKGLTATEGIGSGYWRCVDVSHGFAFWALTGASRSFLVECVAAQRRWNVPGDRVDIFANGTYQMKQPLLDGCYFRGMIRGVNIPTAVCSLRVAGPLVVASTVASATIGANWTADSVMVTLDAVNQGSVTVSVKKNGAEIFTTSCPAVGPARSDYSITNGLTLTGSAGDVISVDVTAITGAPAGLTVTVGPASASHADTVQFGKSLGATGYVNGAIIKNTVLEGSSNSAVQTGDQAFGDFLYDSSWVARDNNYAINFSYSGVPGSPPIRLFAAGNTILPSFSRDIQASVMVYQLNTSQAAPTSYVPDGTNTINPTLDDSLPGLADLSVIWPDCPYIGDPFA